jgi:uncharacterized membrane protein
LVVLLALGAAVSFGALAVTIRLALHPPLDAEAASLVTTFLAGACCVALASATGDFSGLDWADTWPFFVTGLFAPGISQIFFTRAVGLIGPSRTAVFVGVSPVLSAAIAVVVLDEPVHVALVVGTLLIVAGGTLLVREHARPGAFLSAGIALALGAALLFAVRDNLVRWAARGSDVPGFPPIPSLRPRVRRQLRVSLLGIRSGPSHGRRAARRDGVVVGGAHLARCPATVGADRRPPAGRRRARRRRRRAHLGFSLNTPAICSVRMKRVK